MIESVRSALNLPDLRKKIFFTLAMLVIYRLCANIPAPGINLEAWRAFTSGQGTENGLLQILDLLSGGTVSNFSVLALGVYPYITASIIIQLLTPIIPFLEELSAEGESGRNKINRYTYYLMIPLALLQAVGQIRLIGFNVGGIESLVPNWGFSGANLLPTLTLLLAMTGGTMFAVWLGEQITENGIGQGISIIIVGGIVSQIIPNLLSIFALPDATQKWFSIVSFLILTIITILVIVYIHEGQRRIPVQYGRRMRGRKMYQGQSSHLPLKVNTAGMIPIIFAQSIMTFPPIIANFFVSGSGSFVDNIANGVSRFTGQYAVGFGWVNFLYWLVYFVFVVGFTYFYTDVMIRQQKMAEMLQRQGGFIPGIRPGKRTDEYIMKVVRRITFVGAFFLGIVAIMPGIMTIVGLLLNIPNIEQSALVINGAGLIIVVGVVIDTMRQLESQLLMRNYEGFS